MKKQDHKCYSCSQEPHCDKAYKATSLHCAMSLDKIKPELRKAASPSLVNPWRWQKFYNRGR